MGIMDRILEAFERYPLYSQDGKGDDALVIGYFSDIGRNMHWLITEASRLPHGDWEMFGLCDLGFPEFGYVRLSELYAWKGLVGPVSDVEPCSVTVGELRESLGI